MKILLTGGSGFIGRNIKESYLATKYELHAPPRAELNCFEDESVEAYLKDKYFDVVIHSAGKPGHRNAADNAGILYTNSRMIFNLLKHKDRWGKFLNMGSGAVYDMRRYQPKMKEEFFGTHIPADEHGYNKYIFGKLIPHLENVIDFRIFGIYGKYEDYAIRFISNAICKALYGLPITLRQNRKFDYLFIDDLMPILEHFILNKVKYSEYNITPDKSVELLEIAHIVNKVAGRKSEVKVSNEGLGMEYSGDNSRLHSEMKDLQFTPIEKGVESLFNYYKDNLKELNKEVLLTDK